MLGEGGALERRSKCWRALSLLSGGVAPEELTWSLGTFEQGIGKAGGGGWGGPERAEV